MSTPFINFRTDRNNNPTAMITLLAAEAGLNLGVDYVIGDLFESSNRTYYTAKLLGDPVALTIRVIDALGFRTTQDVQRWTYISLPSFDWLRHTTDEKRDLIGYCYFREGGVTMRSLFPLYSSYK
jgi:hypothetical protein